MTVDKKQRIIARDGKCMHCGVNQNLTVDHIIPLSRGGTNDDVNLQTLCTSCNNKKGSNLTLSFKDRIRMLFRFDEILQKTISDSKGAVNGIRTEFVAKIDYLNKQVQSALDKNKNEVSSQMKLSSERIKALETYLKIEYVHDIQEFKGYRKVKK